MASTKSNVFFVCPGLGQVNRGYETFTKECFDTVKDCKEFKTILFKGRGAKNENEITLWNIFRYSSTGKFLGKHFGRGGYFWECLTFFISLIPYILYFKPKLIYFSDTFLGNFLWWAKKIFKFKYKLLICNGGPMSPPFPRWDHVHQCSSLYLKEAINAGEPADKQTLIVQGIHTKKLQLYSHDQQITLKKQLGIPTNRKIILSVCAINKSHKRVDYLIKEVNKLTDLQPLLVVLGQQDNESAEVLKLAEELLGKGNFIFKSVPAEEVGLYYSLADVFALCSTMEGFGRVYIEALSYGLPVIAHDYETTRYILEQYGYYADLTKEGALAEIIRKLLAKGTSTEDLVMRHEFAVAKFDWNNLRNQYIDMILKLI